MGRSGRTAVVVALAALLAMLAWVAAGESAAGAPSSNGNELAAQRDARTLISALQLPAGAVSSSTKPAAGGSVLGTPASRPLTPNLIDDHGWWIVPEKPTAVVSFIKHHPPTGSTLISYGAGSGATAFVSIGFGWPALSHVLSTRWLVVETVSLPSGSTGLRADAEVVWITPRPASERIPPRIDQVTVTVIDGSRVVQGPFSVAAARRVGRAVALIDGLPAAQPGVSSCPVDLGIDIRLAFYRRGASKPLAVALIDAGGCEGVTLTIGGRRRPPLTSAAFPGSGRSQRASLVSQLDAALGVRLRTSPVP